MRLIPEDGFWVAHVPFSNMVKIQFLAQFPVNHLSSPFVPSLVLPSHWSASFAYHVINGFISFSAKPTLAPKVTHEPITRIISKQ